MCTDSNISRTERRDKFTPAKPKVNSNLGMMAKNAETLSYNTMKKTVNFGFTTAKTKVDSSVSTTVVICIN